jgi:DNA-binding NarL/FixJ family response regulator
MTYSDEERAADEATLAERRAHAREQQNARRAADSVKIGQMKDKGYSNAAIAHELGLGESTVRQILDT